MGWRIRDTGSETRAFRGGPISGLGLKLGTPWRKMVSALQMLRPSSPGRLLHSVAGVRGLCFFSASGTHGGILRGEGPETPGSALSLLSSCDLRVNRSSFWASVSQTCPYQSGFSREGKTKRPYRDVQRELYVRSCLLLWWEPRNPMICRPRAADWGKPLVLFWSGGAWRASGGSPRSSPKA